ncbi:hypothetical protein [Candidatus Odyssella thessalonicensis]|uniref:COG4648 family protein n=1 Tax=Candidatus Odyssella thessalonicensis TaxID=84647 RepID=UPI000225BF9E|nr:hypothetical protein [Candidatus Odyssella thessalonicensis]
MRSFINNRLIGMLAAALSIGYPLVIYWGEGKISATTLMSGMLGMLILRAGLPLLTKRGSISFLEKSSVILCSCVTAVMMLLYRWNPELAPFLYPIVMSLAAASLFSYTLAYPPSMIERFARLMTPDLEPKGIEYTRKVTIVWMLFCIINASISLMTVILDYRDLWALYNGCISYLLMGTLMGGELLVRRHHKSNN